MLLFTVHVVNGLLSYLLVYGVWGIPAMGAAGAGLGTTLSMGLGVLLNLWLIQRRQPLITGIRQHSLNSYCHHAFGIIRLGWPASLQQLQFALHFMVLFFLASQLGASALAVTFVVLNMGLLLILPSIGIGLATITLVGQALGQNQPQLANQWGQFAALSSLLLGIVIAILISVLSQYIIPLMVINPTLQHLAMPALQVYALALAADTVGIVLSRALMAKGHGSKAFLIVLTGQWGLFLPLVWLVTPDYGFMAIWWCQLVYRAYTSTLLWFFWQRNISPVSQSPPI
jgi:Na+-driven multidrug efflux pump